MEDVGMKRSKQWLIYPWLDSELCLLISALTLTLGDNLVRIKTGATYRKIFVLAEVPVRITSCVIMPNIYCIKTCIKTFC